MLPGVPGVALEVSPEHVPPEDIRMEKLRQRVRLLREKYHIKWFIRRRVDGIGSYDIRIYGI